MLKTKNYCIEKIKKGDVNILECKDKYYISMIDNKLFLVMRKKISNHFCSRSEEQVIYNKCVDIEMLNDWKKYGGRNSFIVDMQGIKNFINAKALDFKDYYIRAILKEIGLVSERNYLRVGVSGAPDIGIHPGGEVFEKQLINGGDGGGIASSYSGYLIDEDGFSKGVPLCIDGIMSEERMVYSHTAFLEESEQGRVIIQSIESKDDFNFMDYVMTLAENKDIKAFAVQALVIAENDNQISVKGRVLKRRPHKAFEHLSEATEIGNEKDFSLKNRQQMMIVGTYYNRNDIDWYEFTNGREYEKRGHYHAFIENGCDKQHDVFHLRELKMSNNAKMLLSITPIDYVVKMTPLIRNVGGYECAVTGKKLDVLLDEFY